MAQVNIDVAKEDSVQNVITNTAYSATASSAGTLSQKLAYIISTLIGATGSTGGTTTAGTIMAKLNALLTSWTSTRAGYVDATRVNTDINNTASSTGTLSQKLSYLISLITGGSIPTAKSVQRGYVNLSYVSAVVVDTLPREDGIPYIQISITSVNINKTFIIANTSQYLGSSYARAVNAKLVNSNTLRIYATTTNSNTWIYFENINWQVVEFY